jgi:hypothetical protein
MTDADTEVITDPKVKGRVALAIGTQLDLEAEQIQELEKMPLWGDSEGRFMVRTEDAELYVSIPLSRPLLRITEHQGMGRVAEEWIRGHLTSMMLLESKHT